MVELKKVEETRCKMESRRKDVVGDKKIKERKNRKRT